MFSLLLDGFNDVDTSNPPADQLRLVTATNDDSICEDQLAVLS